MFKSMTVVVILGLVGLLLYVQWHPPVKVVWRLALEQAQKDRQTLVQDEKSTGRQLEEADTLIDLLKVKTESRNGGQ